MSRIPPKLGGKGGKRKREKAVPTSKKTCSLHILVERRGGNQRKRKRGGGQRTSGLTRFSHFKTNQRKKKGKRQEGTKHHFFPFWSEIEGKGKKGREKKEKKSLKG